MTRPPDAGLVIEADVVVVGSGSGGGVIAGELAGQGKDVVVLETGGYYNEADFNQLELWAYEHLYRGGGITQTDDGSIVLMAGANLGGGTTVNWTNCLRTKPWVREQWEREYGLEGLAGTDYDRHLDAVSERINVNPNCSDWNGPHLRIKEGCEKLGYDFEVITRNADPSAYDPESAGYLSFGDQSGAKLGTLKTYLQDAADAGAQFVVNCRVDRVLVENGRAAGVEGTYTDEDGRVAPVIVRAPTVVVAGGIARDAGRAAALGHRRAGCGRLPAPAPGLGGGRRLRRAAEGLVGPAAERPVAPVRQPRGRLRVPHRGWRRDAGPEQLGRALGVRGRAQGAHEPGVARPPGSCSSSATAATAA